MLSEIPRAHTLSLTSLLQSRPFLRCGKLLHRARSSHLSAQLGTLKFVVLKTEMPRQPFRKDSQKHVVRSIRPAQKCARDEMHTHPICFLLIAKPGCNASFVKASPRDERGGGYLCPAAHPSPAQPSLSARSSSSPAPRHPGRKG